MIDLKKIGVNSQIGDFEINNQVLTGSTSFTKEIILNKSNYNFGDILLYAPNSIALTANKRMTSYIEFTTEKNNAQAFSGGRLTYNVYGYNFTDYWNKGYRYDDDGKLSDVYFFDNGSQSGLRGQLRIESCQIVNNKIELIFRNTYATRNVNITIKGKWRVFKTN